MKQVVAALREIPFRVRADPAEGEVGASWDDAGYDSGTEGCFDRALKESDERFAMGLPRVRIHLAACTAGIGGEGSKFPGANDCGLVGPFSAGLANVTETSMISWRGFQIAVPSHPFYYLEEIAGRGWKA